MSVIRCLLPNKPSMSPLGWTICWAEFQENKAPLDSVVLGPTCSCQLEAALGFLK